MKCDRKRKQLDDDYEEFQRECDAAESGMLLAMAVILLLLAIFFTVVGLLNFFFGFTL